MKKTFVSLLSVITLTLIGCGGGGDYKAQKDPLKPQDKPNVDIRSSIPFVATAIDWNDTAKYQVELQLDDNLSQKFKNFSKDDFNFSVNDNSSQVNFDTKVQNKVLTLNFTNPINDDLTASFSLKLKEKHKIPFNAIIAFKPINYQFSSIKPDGFDKTQKTRQITLTLKKNQKFNKNIDESMFILTHDLKDVKKSIIKVNDKEIILKLENMPEVLNVESFYVDIKKQAFEHDIFNALNLSIKVSTPNVWVEQESFQFSLNKASFNIHFPTNYKGISNALSLENNTDKISIFNEELKKEDNKSFYKVTLNFTNTLNQDEVLKLLKNTNLNVKLSNDVSFKTNLDFVKPYFIAGLESSPAKAHTIEINLMPKYAKFNKTKVNSINDLIITNSNDITLRNLTLLNASEDKISFSFDTPNKMLTLNISFKDKDILVSKQSLKQDKFDVSFFVSAVDINEHKFVLKYILKPLLSSFATQAGKSLANAIMPTIYKALGIEIRDPLQDIQNEIKALGAELNNLKTLTEQNFNLTTKQLERMQDDILRNRYLATLNDFQNLLSEVETSALTLLSQPEIVNYIRAYEENSKATDIQKQEAKKEFISVFEKHIKDPNDYISKVKILAENMLATSSGQAKGAIASFFDLMDKNYNFSSQTIAQKEEFLKRSFLVYSLGAAFAYDYANLTNNINQVQIANQVKKLEQLNKEFEEKITYAKNLEKQNLDIILFNNKIIYKQMGNTKIENGTVKANLGNFFKKGHYYYNFNTSYVLGVTMNNKKSYYSNDWIRTYFKELIEQYPEKGYRLVYIVPKYQTKYPELSLLPMSVYEYNNMNIRANLRGTNLGDELKAMGYLNVKKESRGYYCFANENLDITAQYYNKDQNGNSGLELLASAFYIDKNYGNIENNINFYGSLSHDNRVEFLFADNLFGKYRFQQIANYTDHLHQAFKRDMNNCMFFMTKN